LVQPQQAAANSKFTLWYGGTCPNGLGYCVLCPESDNHVTAGLTSNALVSQEVTVLASMTVPPILNSNVTLLSLSSSWRESEATRARADEVFCSKSARSRQQPCPFAFLATPAGTHHDAMQLNGYISEFTSSNTGWSGEDDIRNGGWVNKLGLLIAHKQNSSITFTLATLESRIQHLTLHALKSYGETWEGSEAEFEFKVWNDGVVEHETSFRVKGYHNSTTSIAYTDHLDLGTKSAEVGRTVTLSVTSLVGGTTFKIIALMLCSR
jgi:hypothetical protein